MLRARPNSGGTGSAALRARAAQHWLQAAVTAPLRRRAGAWARRRPGEDRLPLTIVTRRVYILPTRAGLAFALLLGLMLTAGLNYANSVALMITFLFGGFALIAMHLTHRNLTGLALRGIATTNGFAGEHARLSITLENAGDSARPGIDCEGTGIERVATDVDSAATARAELEVPLARRGAFRVDRIKVSTAFPFGLFRAWTWVHLPITVLAWPKPQGRREAPAEAATGGQAEAVHRAGDEEWAGLREFRSGDSPRQVAWAAYARGRGLLVKTYESPAAHHRTFDLDSIPGDTEPRLEQLAAWIVAAHARGERYGLRAGPVELAPEGGTEHRTRCLDSLALFGGARAAERGA
jgi:uncharacterized protein (DUF58 family)